MREGINAAARSGSTYHRLGASRSVGIRQYFYQKCSASFRSPPIYLSLRSEQTMVHVISHIDTLLSYSESAITESIPQTPTDFWDGSVILFTELLALLTKRNGFFGLKKSLHVFPTHPSTQGHSGYDLIEWNSRGLRNALPRSTLRSDLLFLLQETCRCTSYN